MFFEIPMREGRFPGGITITRLPPNFRLVTPMSMMGPIETIKAKHGWLLELPYPTCLYTLLGISRTAGEKEINKAYKKLAMKWHPDRNRGREEEASKQFDLANKAYHFLKNSETRSMYDKCRSDILKKQEENSLSSEYKLGDRVVLHGLTSAEYNGLLGHIDKSFDMERRRWPVKLDSGDVKMFKNTKLRFVSRFKEGDRVVLHGLRTASYNGRRGRITGPYIVDRGRWSVKLDNWETKTFKPSNLHFVSEYEKGDRVILHDLTTGYLNGKRGTICGAFSTELARWPVLMDSGNIENVKAQNLYRAPEKDTEEEKEAANERVRKPNRAAPTNRQPSRPQAHEQKSDNPLDGYECISREL